MLKLKQVVVLSVVWWLVNGRQFNNPVIDGLSVPDPGVIKVNGMYYAVSTGANGGNKFPIHVSSDMQNWEQQGYVFNDQTRPNWALPNDAYWAPELHQIGNKIFCYFTARASNNNALSIGVAIADNVLGPYIATNEPIVTKADMGSIDATLMRSGDNIYLIWKDDGNAVGQPTWIWTRQLNPDGLTWGNNVQYGLFREDQPWEGNLVEGVWHVERNGWNYLFYSGNGYCGDKYAVGVARSRGPLGPYEKKPDPILVSNNDFKGPGHCSIVKDVNNVDDVMVYHAYHADAVCNGPRVMLAQTVAWDNNDWPYMA